MKKPEILIMFAEYKTVKGGRGSDLENRLVLQFKDMALAMAHKTQYVDRDAAKSEALYALLQAIRHFKLDRQIDPSTYIWWAVYNALRSLRSKSYRDETVSLEAVAPFVAASEEESESSVPELIVDLINRNPAALPPHTIRLLRAVYVWECPTTIKEQATAAGISVSSMRKKVQKALLQLKDAQ